MENETKSEVQNSQSKIKVVKEASGGGGMVYFFGLIGAAVYYIQQATTFGEGAVGVLKALVWPALLVYELFEFLQ